MCFIFPSGHNILTLKYTYPLLFSPLSLSHSQKPPRSACSEVKINRQNKRFFHLKIYGWLLVIYFSGWVDEWMCVGGQLTEWPWKVLSYKCNPAFTVSFFKFGVSFSLLLFFLPHFSKCISPFLFTTFWHWLDMIYTSLYLKKNSWGIKHLMASN